MLSQENRAIGTIRFPRRWVATCKSCRPAAFLRNPTANSAVDQTVASRHNKFRIYWNSTRAWAVIEVVVVGKSRCMESVVAGCVERWHLTRNKLSKLDSISFPQAWNLRLNRRTRSARRQQIALRSTYRIPLRATHSPPPVNYNSRCYLYVTAVCFCNRFFNLDR